MGPGKASGSHGASGPIAPYACAACLLVLWLFALGVLTFARAPFTPASGNGYFACWLGFFSAASLTLLEAAAYLQHR